MAKTVSTVWRRDNDNMGYGCNLTNGARTIRISHIVIYDESGPIITNYTNLNEFTFDLMQGVSTKPVDTPDWTNKAGFVMLDSESTHAELNRLIFGARSYWLCLHIDNTRPYVRELCQWWEMYTTDTGSIRCTFSLEGCKFSRIVGNPSIEYAKQGIRDILGSFDPDCNVFNNTVHATHNIGELIEACNHIKQEAINYRDTARDIRNNYGIIELIEANGANGPINHHDYFDITRYTPFTATYRIA